MHKLNKSFDLFLLPTSASSFFQSPIISKIEKKKKYVKEHRAKNHQNEIIIQGLYQRNCI